MTNPPDTAVTCLSFADLYALIGPESTGLRQVGGRRGDRQGAGLEHDLPGRRPRGHRPRRGVGHVRLLHRGRRPPIADERDQSRGAGRPRTRPDYTSTANDNVIIEGITRQPELARLGRLRLRRGEQGQGPGDRGQQGRQRHLRRAERRDDRRRQLPAVSRPLFIYVNKAKAAENPAVAAYVDYYLADGTIDAVLKTVPYVNLPAAELDASRRVGGLVDGR